MELKDKLRALRKKHGMTQDEMAEALLVSRQTVCKWETGKVQPDMQRLRQLCLLFKVSSDELLDIRTDATGKMGEWPEQAAQTEITVPARRRRKRLRWMLMAAAALLLCGVAVALLTRQSQEIQQALALGVVPAELADGLNRSVTEKELLALLSNVCRKETGNACPALTAAAAAATNEQMTREKAAYWLYCTHIWTKLDANASLAIGTHAPPDPIAVRNVYADLNAQSRSHIAIAKNRWESALCRELAKTDELFQAYDGTEEMDKAIDTILCGSYYTSVAFCLAQRSFANDKPLLEAANGAFRPKDRITGEEAILAAYRLYGSW